MRYAIISDIHGNLSALDIVLKDARLNKVDTFIFVGDYCLSNPFPNEVILRLRSLENSYIIRGNEEKYLENLKHKNPKTWIDGQMQISYYCYREINRDNLEWLTSLPTSLKIVDHNITLHIAHSSDSFIGDCEFRKFSTDKVAKRYTDKFINHVEFNNDINEYLNHDKNFLDKICKLEDGVYIFGHTHTHWHYISEDRKKVFINPGSCGLPLDCTYNRIPYTILDISEDEKIHIEEKGIHYNKELFIKEIEKSRQYIQANVWSKIIIEELKTSREHLTFFLQFVKEYAEEINDTIRPYTIEAWEKAYYLYLKTIKN